MYLYGTLAANMYGSDSDNEPPFSRIVIPRGAYNYEIVKYLCNLLIPYIPSEYCANDTFSHF